MSRILSPRVLLTIVVVFGVIIGSRILFPVPLPVIQLPAERIIPITDDFYITNTLIATLITDVTLIVLALLATRNMQLVPSGIQNVVEALIEFIYNLAQDLAGHNAKRFFPWAMTIFLLILVSNWWELIPGVDSIGLLESHSALTAEDATSPGGEEVLQEEMLDHYRVQTLFPGVATLTDANSPYKPTAEEYHDAHEHHTIVTREDGAQYAVLTPFVRAATTDLNLTLGLAIVVMVMVQVYGFQALGAGYLTKFFNFKGGPVGIFVGLIELISEFAKIISFGFRLFGNIFAGQVLLFVMAFLLPWLLPLPFYGLETFVGFIQAVVFAGLALIFMQGATESHDAEHH